MGFRGGTLVFFRVARRDLRSVLRYLALRVALWLVSVKPWA